MKHLDMTGARNVLCVRRLVEYVEDMLPVLEEAIDHNPDEFTSEQKQRANEVRWALLDYQVLAG